ncbi:MAG: ankyrin repeat domain-containing protein [Pseudomonadota bacterium]
MLTGYFFRVYSLIIVMVLINLMGCNNASDDQTTEPALVTLAEKGELGKVQELLSLGEKADILDSCLWSPLMKAAQYGHIEIVKLLLAKGSNVEQADKGGYTALLLATSRNQYQIVELLLAHNANINHQESSMGWSALIWATKMNYIETVEVLLNHQADTKLKDYQDNTALMWAKTIKSKQLMQLLSSK